MSNVLIYGIGRNNIFKCEKYIYMTWKNMLMRCYSSKYKFNQPTYNKCSVDPSWHTLSDFRTWFLSSNYKPGLALDKDIINRGNKVYGPDNCSFVSHRINSLVVDSGAARGKYKIGVNHYKRDNNYCAHCAENGKSKHLGLFKTEEEAFQAYKSFKEAHIKVVAEEEYQLGNCTKEVRDALFNWTI